jgi:hypothetical protein
MLPETGGDLLLSLFHHSLLPRHDTSYDSYEPDRISVPARHATYSANLALLAVLAAGEITEQQLFPGHTEPVDDWRRITLLWRSQLPEKAGGVSFTHWISIEDGTAIDGSCACARAKQPSSTPRISILTGRTTSVRGMNTDREEAGFPG